MSSATLKFVETYTTITCPENRCGITFAIHDGFRDRRVDDHKSFYYPNGHTMSYGHRNELEEAQAEAKRLAKVIERREEDLRFEQRRLTNERRSHAATKGQLTKTKRRIAHGVCPCCTRTFAQLDRHMRNQHPEYVEAAKA